MTEEVKISNSKIVIKLVTDNPQQYSRKDILEITGWTAQSLQQCIYHNKLSHLVKKNQNNHKIVVKLVTDNPQQYSRKDILEITGWTAKSLKNCIQYNKLSHLIKKKTVRVRFQGDAEADYIWPYSPPTHNKIAEYYKLYNQEAIYTIKRQFIQSRGN